MASSASKMMLKSVDDLFTTEEQRQEAQGERVIRVPLSELHFFKGYPPMQDEFPFLGQPYKVRDNDPKMLETLASVKVRGVITPGIVRPDPDGGYELISGHRRHRASDLSGIPDMPVIVREMTDEDAAIEVVDGNIQREDVLPSEKAWAFRMKLEATKRKAGKPLANSPQVAANYRSDDEVAESMGISGDTLRRYINLTRLIPALMDLVDNKKIAFTPASELSFLKKEEQAMLLDAMESEQTTPSLSQAQRLKKFSQDGNLTPESMRAIMSEEKKPEVSKISFSGDQLSKYFPKSYTPQKMEETIIKLLEGWRKRLQSQER